MTTNTYHLAHNDAIIVNLNARGRLLLRGRDRLSLVHRMSTNAIETLADGDGVITVLTTPIGRIIDLLHVIHMGEDALVITSERRGEAMRQYFQRNIFFNDKVNVTSITDSTVMWGVFGVKALNYLKTLIPAVESLPLYHALMWQDVRIIHTDPIAGHGFLLLGEPDPVNALVQQLQLAGASEATSDVYDLLRVEAGQPLPTNELTEDYIPLEAGLWHGVSFNKGCYTGQEIIARMESRGKLAKMLVKLSADVEIPVQSTLYNEDGKSIGTLTSLIRQPESDRFLGLGFVKPAVVSDNATLSDEHGHVVTIMGIAGTQPKN